MSWRCRYFENYAYRKICYDYWTKDNRVKWICAPKPSNEDSLYDLNFFEYGVTNK